MKIMTSYSFVTLWKPKQYFTCNWLKFNFFVWGNGRKIIISKDKYWCVYSVASPSAVFMSYYISHVGNVLCVVVSCVKPR